MSAFWTVVVAFLCMVTFSASNILADVWGGQKARWWALVICLLVSTVGWLLFGGLLCGYSTRKLLVYATAVDMGIIIITSIWAVFVKGEPITTYDVAAVILALSSITVLCLKPSGDPTPSAG